MRIEKCYFCSSSIYPGHGTRFIRGDCTNFFFCRSKCRNAFKKKWNPRKSKWTKAFRIATRKEIITDNIFERRKDTLPHYNREEIIKTVNLIPAITELRYQKQDFYYKDRMLSIHEKNKKEDMRILEIHKNLCDKENNIKEERIKEIEQISKSN
ncbi:60S ribosomal protein L24 [Spraguea lophii 42_110]|uniref:60S ribosomal protein L24 n=1 Tax=Spraguea lophii (strain 42_110) TaxID=1358809 RepID=S7WEA5_SPRLO|nr:60S ribosomal protein L24 [Spraguea lophii 42_110]